MTRRTCLTALAALVACATLAACTTSPTPHAAALADRNRGATGDVRLLDGRLVGGELLAVEDSAIVLLAVRRVAVVPFSEMHSVDFGFARFSAVRSGTRWPSEATRRIGARDSRFPFGVSAAVLASLLAEAGQTAPDTLRSGRAR